MIEVKVKKIHPDAILPKYAHEGDSGMDLYSIVDCTLKPFERKAIPTGLEMAIPLGYEGQVRPRSGVPLKYGLIVGNSPGTVDAIYRGEVKIIMINLDPKNDYEIKKGDKIAQIVFSSVERAVLEEVSELDETTRGAGGFGSTGK